MRSYFQKALRDPQASFAGRNILVTGANSGLGLEAAIKFAKLDAAQLVLAVRDVNKGHQARAHIQQQSRSGTVIHVLPLDMSSYDSVRAFVAQLSQTLECLDIALLNAGVFSTEFKRSPHGFEETMQVNMLSTALLALLLIPQLKRSPGISTLEIVSSRRQMAFKMPPELRQAPNLIESFNEPAKFVPSKQYQGSKLLITAFSQRLAGLIHPSTHGVSVVAACPGFCASSLSRGYSSYAAVLFRWVLDTFIMRTAEEGARTLVSGASLGGEGHGQFWFDDELSLLSAPETGSGGNLQEQVWKEVITMLQSEVPELHKIGKEIGADFSL
ncbi:short chain dehydrogenase domain-containing protein [Sarocladium implicatum]|nr:short chain dehydrogenase domain-containing protein [Sarocladium implicatum]